MTHTVRRISILLTLIMLCACVVPPSVTDRFVFARARAEVIPIEEGDWTEIETPRQVRGSAEIEEIIALPPEPDFPEPSAEPELSTDPEWLPESELPRELSAKEGTTLTENGFSYTVNEETLTATVTGYTGTDANVVIPGTVGQGLYTVTAIGKRAFSDCDVLASIDIPNTIVEIGEYAFYSCSSLKTVSLPKSITSLGAGVFFACASLETVDLGSIATIPDYAFDGCKKLTAVTIPNTVTKIGYSAFCSSGLTSVTIPDNVTTWTQGEYGWSKAFDSCAQLESVRLGRGLTTIAPYVFGRCPKLQRVVVTGSTRFVSAFNEGSSVIEIEYTDTVTEIPDYALQNNTQVISVSIGENVVSIGNAAFQGCSGLTTVDIPDTVETIGENAFQNCANLRLLVGVGSAAAVYAEAHTIPFDYRIVESAELQVELNTIEALSDYVGSRIEVYASERIVASTTVIPGTSAYGFSGLPIRQYALRLTGVYGDTLAALDNVSVVAGINPVRLDISTKLANAAATVVDAENADVTDRAHIVWRDAEGASIATGATIERLPVGKNVTVHVALPKALGEAHREPGPVAVTIAETGNDYTIALTSFAKKTLSGHVVDAQTGEIMFCACIMGTQNLNEKYPYHFGTVTNAQGKYEVSIFDAPYTMTVSYVGYKDWTGDETNTPETIELVPIDGATVALACTYRFAAEPGANNLGTADADDMRVEVYNITQNRDEPGASLQYPTLVMPDGVMPGDTLRVTVSSANRNFAPVSGETTIGNDEKATLELALMQYGCVRIAVEASMNDETVGLLYDQAGECVASTRFTNKSALIPGVQAGEYTLILMGYHTLLRGAPNLGMLDSLGLTEGADYIRVPVTVRDAEIALAQVEIVPRSDANLFSYTDKAVVTANRTETTAGNYVTIKAEAALKPEYAGATDVTWQIAIPANAAYVGGTAMLGRTVAVCAQDGNMLSIPTSNLDDALRLCVVPLQEGEYHVGVFVRFQWNGQTVTQPVGTAQFVAKGLTFVVPNRTSRSVIDVRGTANIHTTVFVYDGDRCLGQAQTTYNGTWSTRVDLGVADYTSFHSVYVVAVSNTDARIRVQSGVQLVRYSPDTIELDSVTMINTAHSSTSHLPREYETVFDYSGTSDTSLYYLYWPDYPEFSFVVRFSQNDPVRIDDVRLTVRLTDGGVRSFDCVYAQDKGAWVASGTFTIDTALPTQVGVSYVCDDEFIPSPEITQFDPSAYASVIGEEHMDANAEYAAEKAVITHTYKGVPYMTQTIESDLLTPDAWRQLKATGRFQADGTLGGIATYTAITNIETGSVIDTIYEGDVYCLRITTRYESELIEIINHYVDLVTDPLWRECMEAVGVVVDTSVDEYGNIDYKALEKGLQRIKANDNNFERVREDVDAFREEYESSVFGQVMGDVLNIAGLMPGIGSYASIAGGALYMGEISAKSIALIQDALSSDCLDNGQKTLISGLATMAIPIATVATTAGGMFDTIGTVLKLASAASELWDKLKLDTWYFMNDRYVTDYVDSLGQLVVVSETNVYNDYKEKYDRVTEKNNLFREQVDMYFKASKDFAEGWMRYSLEGLNNMLDAADQCDDPETDSKPTDVIRDPAGYVYEAVASNLLSGVKATCMQEVTEYDIYGDPTVTEEVWDAEAYGQVNPQITGADGAYAWDVPDGKWRVHYEKAGYENAQSDWMIVPPPHFDVNVGLVSYAQPEVGRVAAYPDDIELTFTKYMRAKTLTNDNITVMADATPVSGTIRLLDAEPNPGDLTEIFASKCAFVPDAPLQEGAAVTVSVASAVKSYAGVAVKAINANVSVAFQPQSLTSDAELTLAYGESGTIRLHAAPESAVAGRTVTVTPVTRTLFSVDEAQVTLDANGEAVVHVKGLTPGSSEIRFALENTDIASTSKVVVSMPQPVVLTVPVPTALPASGATVAYGTKVRLTCTAPNATIYYTLDGSCPCLPETRKTYTAPLTLTESATILAVAEKPGMNASQTERFVYTVIIPEITAVAIKGAKMLAIGGTAQLRANLTPDEAAPILWTSDNEAVATVDAQGRVTGVKAGKATITATVGALSAQHAMTVGKYVHTITLTGMDGLASGKKTTIKATVLPKNAKKRSVTWTSSNTSVATVSKKGAVTAAKGLTAPKTVTITATAMDGSGIAAQHRIRVYPIATSVAILPGGTPVIDLATGTTLKLSAMVEPANGWQAVTWTTSSKKIATVDETGLVTAKKAGTVAITAKAKDGSGKSRKITVKIARLVKRLTITGGAHLGAGKSTTLKAAAEPTNATNRAVTWTSSDTNVATVSKKGAVKAAKGLTEPRNVIITATAKDGSGVAATHTITVYPLATGVTIAPETPSIRLTAGESTLQLSATVEPANGWQAVTWSSGNTKIATVDENCLVTAKKIGKVAVTAKAKDGSGKLKKVTVTVE